MPAQVTQSNPRSARKDSASSTPDAKEVASKAKVEALLKEKGATLWIQHDIEADAKLKKSPAYYD